MATNLDLAIIRRMAQLSRLRLSENEELLFSGQLSRILDHLTLLQSVDTENVEPLYNVAPEKSAVRPDKADNRRTRAEILANAPASDGIYFIVPKIV